MDGILGLVARIVVEWILGIGPEAVTALATVAIAVSAIVTARLTLALARENRLLRKAETEPEVVAYLANHPHIWEFVNFVVANVGRGPARNVSFVLHADENNFEENEVAVRNSKDRKPISFLPQGETISLYFGPGHQFVQDPKLLPFEVVIKYEDMSGRKRSNRVGLDFAQFEGFSTLGMPPEQETADSLKKIEKHLAALVSSDKRLRSK